MYYFCANLFLSMIQRIQSVFLLITAMALVVFLGTNAYIKTISATETVTVNAYNLIHSVGGLNTGKPIFYVAVMAGIAVLVSIIALFQYKNRTRQILFVAFNALLMGATLATVVYHIVKGAQDLGGSGEGSYEVGFFAIIIAMLSNTIANWFIKRDERLVKSADRMR